MNIYQLVLKRWHISESALLDFKPYLQLDQRGKICFLYTENGMAVGHETCEINAHLVPATTGLWMATPIHGATRAVYLFYSALDALLFYQQNPKAYRQVVFIALGLRVSQLQILRIKQCFPKAMIHAVFGSDLLAHVNACKVACLWLRKIAHFYLYEGELKTTLQTDREFTFNPVSFSLNQFLIATGLRIKMRQHNILNNEHTK